MIYGRTREWRGACVQQRPILSRTHLTHGTQLRVNQTSQEIGLGSAEASRGVRVEASSVQVDVETDEEW